MATQPSWFRRPQDPSRESSRTSPGGEALRAVPPRAHPLRPLPNEDVYFYAKRIDNSRMVREENPQARGECWSAIGAGIALAVLLISTLLPALGGILTGYQVEALKQERQRLVDERRNLELQEAALVSRERLEELAGSQALVKPLPGQVILLEASASESLALNVEGKK